MESLFILSIVVLGVASYPTGAPVFKDDANNVGLCTDMFPVGHNVTAKTDSPPFTITFTLPDGQECFNTGDEVAVKIGNDSLTFYEGLFVQAKRADKTDKNYGTFDVTGGDRLKTVPCFNTDKTAVTHSNKFHFWEHSFKWIAPETKHNLEFVATIVHETDEFWVNVKSAELKNCDVSGAGAVTAGVLSVLLTMSYILLN